MTSRYLVLLVFTLSSILGTGSSIADASSSSSSRIGIVMPPSPIEAGKNILLGARSALNAVSKRTRGVVPLSTRMPMPSLSSSSSLLKLPKQTPSTSITAPTTTDSVLKPLSYYLRVGLAGGLAGATGTSLLYPMDSAKT
jgi:hypothetical protein